MPTVTAEPTTASVITFIVDYYKQRLSENIHQDDIHNELKDMLSSEQIQELWNIKYAWILSNVYAEQERANRAIAQSIQRDTESKSPMRYFGERRINPETLRDPETVRFAKIFETTLMVRGKHKMIGLFTKLDWKAKASEYYEKADHAFNRGDAATAISERLTGSKVTQESLTAEEFTKLMPEEGF